MARWKRLIYYLLINVFVSACTITVILLGWERYRDSSLLAPLVVTPPVRATSGGSAGADQPAQTAATATAELETYAVQPGDTLALIAVSYGLTSEAIAAANSLENPNALSVGQVLVIPLPVEVVVVPDQETPSAGGGEPAATTTPPVLEDLPTATALPEGYQIEVEIVTVVAAGDLEREHVVISLLSEGELSLRDWRLEDEDGNIFVFPNLKLFKGGAVSIYTRSGVNNVVELYWGQSETVWEQGEVITLFDPQGNAWAAFRIP